MEWIYKVISSCASDIFSNLKGLFLRRNNKYGESLSITGPCSEANLSQT